MAYIKILRHVSDMVFAEKKCIKSIIVTKK